MTPLDGLDRYGLDYASVAGDNPRVVYCSISGFGRGAGADKPGYDFLVQAVGGLMSVTGEAGGNPVKVGAPVVDVLTGKDAVIGILAALAARERSGAGQHVQVELLSSLLGGLVNQTASYLASGVSPTRRGNVHPSVVPYQTLRCADLPIAVACGNDRQFARLAAVLGVPELATDPRFVTNADRVSHQPELEGLLEDALAHADAATWEQRLGAAGVPAGLVGNVESAIERSRALGLEPLVELGPGVVPQIRHPIGYSVSEVAPAVTPPTVGEDTDYIAAWLASPPDTPLPRVSARRSGGTGR